MTGALELQISSGTLLRRKWRGSLPREREFETMKKDRDPVGTGPAHSLKFARNITTACDLRLSVSGNRGS